MTAPKALPKTAKARVRRGIGRGESIVVRMWMFRALKLSGVVKSWISQIGLGWWGVKGGMKECTGRRIRPSAAGQWCWSRLGC